MCLKKTLLFLMSVSMLSGCGDKASNSEVTRNVNSPPPQVTNPPSPQVLPSSNPNPPPQVISSSSCLSTEKLDMRASKFITDVKNILTKRRIFSLYDLDKISDGVDCALSDAIKIYEQRYGYDKTTLIQVVSFIYNKKIDDFDMVTEMQRAILKLAFGRLERSLS